MRATGPEGAAVVQAVTRRRAVPRLDRMTAAPVRLRTQPTQLGHQIVELDSLEAFVPKAKPDRNKSETRTPQELQRRIT